MATTLTIKRMGQEAPDDRTDDQLMIAYGRKDRAAFDELYSRYRQPLWGYLYNNCRDEAAASEMFQDVWLRVISSSRQYERKDRFRSWLFTVAHNRLVDFYRRGGREVSGGDQIAEIERGVDAEEHDEVRARLERVVGELPFDQRQAFYLREECGFAVREIAEIQQITVEAAKSRLRYAYKRLRELLQEEK